MSRIDVETRIWRALIYNPEYRYFCCGCMTQYAARPERCLFCGSREFKENTLENFVNHETCKKLNELKEQLQK